VLERALEAAREYLESLDVTPVSGFIPTNGSSALAAAFSKDKKPPFSQIGLTIPERD